MNSQRVRQLNPRYTISSKANPRNSTIIYWMSRDQRVQDNWALLYAQELAIKHRADLCVIFCLQPSFLGATLRHYDFMISGLRDLEKKLNEKRISFQLLFGDPVDSVTKFLKTNNAIAVVMDFSPLKIGRQWREMLASELPIPLYEVDAHNCIPAWIASSKLEFGAYTMRPKLWKLFPKFREVFPQVKTQLSANSFVASAIDWEEALKSIRVDRKDAPITWLRSGEQAAHEQLDNFVQHRLAKYDEDHNDPNLDGQSNLSAYLHFGQLSAQMIIQFLLDHVTASSSRDVFLEEIFIRRELADNFCLYNPNYDTPKGFASWAITSHLKHATNAREFVYSSHEFELALTHDDLWNAAQIQLIKTGKMHGYMRMYWAKKIFEWTASPEVAMRTAIYLNDKYEIDGRDPNGYAGIAWAIGGTHDRAWFDRPVYGKIRYMNASGASRKFDVQKYSSNFLDMRSRN